MSDSRKQSGSQDTSALPQHTFGRGPFATSPSAHTRAAANNDTFSPTSAIKPPFPQISPTTERRPAEFGPPPQLQLTTSDPSQQTMRSARTPAVLLRKLPSTTTAKDLRSMMLFAKELIDVAFVNNPGPEDVGYSTAVAFFRSAGAASDAQKALDGKLNAAHDANMIVETFTDGTALENELSHTLPALARFRRSTIDGTSSRNQVNSASSNGSNTESYHRQTSRYNSTFHAADDVSPPPGHGGEFPVPESSTHFQTLFSPRSPNNTIRDHHQQNLGKNVINTDGIDDETDGLIRDPLAYARNGHRQLSGRADSDQQVPMLHLRNLNLGGGTYDNYGQMSNPNSSVTSPSTMPGRQDYMSAKYTPRHPQSSYNGPSAPKTSYPPANPADQNPPCNTLYVGNLPNNTSEDELKRLFSSQRGYKRLCFRTKSQGPMCFVEFENVTLATQALHHLYGKMLSNSIKGGIRLSFSKNPLGVRNGQSGMSPQPVMGQQGPPPGFGNGMFPPPGFLTATGPPPGFNGSNTGRTTGYGPTIAQDQYDYQSSNHSGPFASQLSMPTSSMYMPTAPVTHVGGYVPAYSSHGMTG